MRIGTSWLKRMCLYIDLFFPRFQFGKIPKMVKNGGEIALEQFL
jgi:hypothetical protein